MMMTRRNPPMHDNLSRLTLRLLALLAVAFLATLSNTGAVGAQSSLGQMRRQATRPELERTANLAEAAASSAPDAKTRERLLADANSIRQRLRNGDFIPGDRILIQVVGDTVLSDTFTVRMDQVLNLPVLPDLSLRGVLDSELEPYLTKHFAKYIRNVDVTATGLLRVYVGGGFTRPGFLTVPVDLALTDLINAGGPNSGTDLGKAVVRRGEKVVVDRGVLRDAIRMGKTVGDISMRDGDEIFMPAQGSGLNWTTIAGGLSAAMGTYWMIRYGFGRGRP